jgi:hypothetical protein
MSVDAKMKTEHGRHGLAGPACGNNSAPELPVLCLAADLQAL